MSTTCSGIGVVFPSPLFYLSVDGFCALVVKYIAKHLFKACAHIHTVKCKDSKTKTEI